jgi:hypothetical protein
MIPRHAVWILLALAGCSSNASPKPQGTIPSASGGAIASTTETVSPDGGPPDAPASDVLAPAGGTSLASAGTWQTGGSTGTSAPGGWTTVGGASSGLAGTTSGLGGTTSRSGGTTAGTVATVVDAAVSADATAKDAGAVPGWSDVSPVRTRLGPQTLPRQLFLSETQFGSYWETPSGDLLTTFRTSITSPDPGIAIYDYNYKMQTVAGGAIKPVPDLAIGTCRYQDPPYYSCSIGPDPDGPSPRSLVTDDGKILVVREKAMPNSMMHPIVEQLDPATGTLSPLVELSDLVMHASSLAYTSTLNLLQLGDHTVALATAMQGDPARTAVFDTAGTLVGQHAGFAFGERWQRFALFLGENSGPYNQRFDWWDPRSDATERAAFGFPAVTPSPGFRTFVTSVGDVIFPGSTYTDRLVHIDQDSNVVEDRALLSTGFLGATPDGHYLAYEKDATLDAGLNYVLRLYDRKGGSTVIYDDPTLMREAKWPALGSGGYYPVMDRLDIAALIDDAGNAYVGFVLQTGGNTQTETYLVAFAPDGSKLWGLNLKTTNNGTCQARRILSGHRLVVTCWGRYVRRFIILGE